MTIKQAGQFRGFTRETFAFLGDIGQHNEKAWFDAHRAGYDQHVLQPLRDLVADLAHFMLTIDLAFEVTPAVGKTISRIYRDTRFSPDKRPFRDCMWIVFKRPGQDWSGYLPGYFLEITPDSCRYGMGFYDAAPKLMARFRQQLDEDPDTFLEAINWFDKQDALILHGETYKRPMGEEKPESIRAWYKLKNFYLSCDCAVDEALLSRRFASQVMRHFDACAPLYHYLQRLAATVPR